MTPSERSKLQLQLSKRQLEDDREHLAALQRRLNRTAETVRRAERAITESYKLLRQLSQVNG